MNGLAQDAQDLRARRTDLASHSPLHDFRPRGNAGRDKTLLRRLDG